MYHINMDTFFEKPDEDLKNMLKEVAGLPLKEAIEEEQGLYYGRKSQIDVFQWISADEAYLADNYNWK